MVVPLILIILILAISFAIIKSRTVSDSESQHDFLQTGSSQPLRSVFYKFDHASTNSWVAWIIPQDQKTKSQAFKMLSDYLEQSPEKLGLITSEVVEALISFSRPDCFHHLQTLLENVRIHWGEYRHVNSFYKLTALGLVKVNSELALSTLKEELNLIKDKKGSASLRESLLEALVQIDYSEKLVETWSDLLLDFTSSTSFKQELLDALGNVDARIQDAVYSQFINYSIKLKEKDANLNYKTLFSSIFPQLKNIINKGMDRCWYQALEAGERGHFQEVFTSFVSELTANEKVKLKEEHLLALLSCHEPARTSYKTALAKRFNLSEEEIALTRLGVKAEHLEFGKEPFTVEKFDDVKPIISELSTEYYFIENNIIKNKENIRVGVLTGDAKDEKLYLVRSLAANNNRSFVYVDSHALLSTNMAFKLQSIITASKPTIVYIDNLYKLLSQDLTNVNHFNVQTFNAMLEKLSPSPSISFIANILLSDQSEEWQSNLKLKEIVDNEESSLYFILSNVVMPNTELREKILEKCIKKVNPERISKSFSFPKLMNSCQDPSLIVFLNSLCNYFERNLLINGKLA